MTITEEFGLAGVWFGRTVIGLITRPYQTYRRVIDQGHVTELVYLAAGIALYFIFASLVRIAELRPLLLTRQFVVLVSAAIATYLLVVGAMWVIGRALGGKGEFRGLILGWGYSLVPTLLWFIATSLLYVLLPPPRTTSGLGFLFSGVYLVFTGTLFFWKAMLTYLTLRFALHLDLWRIIAVWLVMIPILAAYSVALYWLGIFRVPFI